MKNVLIGNKSYHANGWAVIFAGGSASGKSTLIKNGRMLFKGETLSTDTLGENIIEVHNNAARYAKENPELLAEAEKLVAAGMQTRYPEQNVLNKVQNVHLDFDAITVTPGKVSTILSNGAHAQKEQLFRKRIKANAEDDMKNILLDITGNEKDVTGYTEYLKSLGYKVAVVWVITNRSVALLWNHFRPRAMKVGAVHTGHDNPNRYLLDALQDGRLADVDDAWLVFNSSDAIGKEMTDDEKAQSAIQLHKKAGKYIIAPQLAERVRRTLGPNPPSAEKENAETPQWQMDETGKQPMVIDDAFMEKYTLEVTLEDGTKARALLQLRSSFDKKKGGLVVIDDKKGGTGLPKLQKCNKNDTPSYPYVIITEADKGKYVQRRHGMMSGYKLKYEKTVSADTARYASADWMKKTFDRIRIAQKVARDNGVAEPKITDFIVSFLDCDKKTTETRLKDFYKAHGLREPALKDAPMEVYDVNEPVREQFLGKNGEANYQEAVRLYPEQKAAYEKAVKEWKEYNKQFE